MDAEAEADTDTDTDIPVLQSNFNAAMNAASVARPRNTPRLVIQCNFDKAFVTKNTDECAICYESVCNAQLNCKHEFCTGCIRKSIETVLQNNRRSMSCPMCRADIDGIVSNREEEVAGLSRMLQMTR
jgi:hypothetical protein